MQCPYCGKEMELGLVQSPHEIAWLKGDTKHAFAIAAAHKDAIVLSPLNIKNMITGCAVRAFLCRSCKKVIIILGIIVIIALIRTLLKASKGESISVPTVGVMNDLPSSVTGINKYNDMAERSNERAGKKTE